MGTPSSGIALRRDHLVPRPSRGESVLGLFAETKRSVGRGGTSRATTLAPESGSVPPSDERAQALEARARPGNESRSPGLRDASSMDDT